MLVLQSELSVNEQLIRSLRYLLPCELCEACFFDIETTGLSAKISNVYLIGAARFTKDRMVLTQWFADDYTSEASLLMQFSDYLADCTHVIHYNGTTFDVPYLEKKYVDHGLKSPFIHTESLDLYRSIASHKAVFATGNHKLVTMEKWIGFDRGDDCNGKECIKLYTDYMQMKFAHRDPEMNALFETILKHNRDDVCGTFRLAEALYYTDCRPNSPTAEITETSVVLTDRLPDGLSFPVPLTHEIIIDATDTSVRLEFGENTLTLTVPLIRETLFHYFPDYKNYYYLPDEDMAIHKSVGTYVDQTHRKPATSATCYIKKSGTFLPLPKHASLPDQPVFHKKSGPKTAPYIDASTLADLSATDLKTLFSSYLQ